MSVKEDFAHPTTFSYDPAFAAGSDEVMFHGLTKREFFFINILNGLLAGRLSPDWMAKDFIEKAIEMTNNSIDRLNEIP